MALPTKFDPRVLDNFAWFSHKAGLDGVTNPNWVTVNWLPAADERRLSAYKVLAAYKVNNARQMLTDIPSDKRVENREYGDAALICSRIVAGILGDEIRLMCPEYLEALADPPSLTDRPLEPGDDADDIERLLFDAMNEVWTEEKTEAIEMWQAKRAKLGSLQAGCDWIDWWMDVEHVVAKVTEAETEYAVPLGDAVYGLAWSTEKRRPILTLYPPDAYLPELDDDGGFPDVVHLVWQEVPDNTSMVEEDHVRRITYRLVDQEERPDLNWGALPYGDEAPTHQCVLTDVTFNLANHSRRAWTGDGANVTTWANSLGEINVNEDGEVLDGFPLGIDFIPIVHVPNTPSTVDHFGTSSLARVARLLDDIVATDTDIQRAAALAGSPVLGLSGVNVDPSKPLDIFPGKVLGLGADGKIEHVDMSASVDVLDRTKDALLERLAVNVQIPESMLGRIDEVRQFPSGVALRMSFQSFIQLIDTLRLPRQSKYRMLLRFAQRLQVANGGDVTLTAGETINAYLEFGEFIPADIETTTATVASLLNSHGISRSVASTMLQEVGIPIEDVKDEVAAIGREDTEGAKNAADATGSETVAAELLGVDIEVTTLPQATALPQINLP